MQPLEPRQTIGAQDVMVERRAESVCKRHMYLVSASAVQKNIEHFFFFGFASDL